MSPRGLHSTPPSAVLLLKGPPPSQSASVAVRLRRSPPQSQSSVAVRLSRSRLSCSPRPVGHKAAALRPRLSVRCQGTRVPKPRNIGMGLTSIILRARWATITARWFRWSGAALYYRNYSYRPSRIVMGRWATFCSSSARAAAVHSPNNSFLQRRTRMA